MYFALEGIKGSGKTTVFEAVCNELALNSLAFATLRPTHRIGEASVIEFLQRKTGQWWPDWLVERFFAMRSNRQCTRLPKRCSLVFGERSVLTSYVTRWNPQS